MAEGGKNVSGDNAKRIATDEKSLDAISIIKAEHKEVDSSFDAYKAASRQEKSQLAEKICFLILSHSAMEERLQGEGAGLGAGRGTGRA